MSTDDLLRRARESSVGGVPPATQARAQGALIRRRRRAGALVAALAVTAVLAGSAVQVLTSSDRVSPAGKSAGLIVTRPGVAYPFGGDDAEAAFEVTQGCILYGGLPAAFPVGSELRGSVLAIAGMRPKEVRLGEDVELSALTFDVSEVGWLELYLDESNREGLESCASASQRSQYVVVM